jgi:Flp pilus assembly protein TadD
MTRNIGVKFAVSALAIGVTMVACKPAAEAMRPASASANPARAEKQAAEAFARAQAEFGKGHLPDALRFAEESVTGSPHDLAYRMLLADLYLKSGRFQSAATTYGDVLSLDPGNQRASLSIVLCDIAQGRNAEAVAMLDSIAQNAPAADVGLAYAMAGQPARAVELLEPAARAPGATGRIRQNLAFAYAIAGDWQKARVTAAQDVSPADLGPRLEQWATLARPGAGAGQVAALLGVRPGADAGQPERLALVAAPAPTALAAADPAPAPIAPEAAPAPAPVQQAAAEPIATPAPAAPQAPVAIASAAPDASWVATVRQSEDPKPQAQDVARPLYAGAVQSLVTPQPAILRTGRAFRVRPAGFELPRAAPAPRAGAEIGRYAVQLGAFSSSNAAERAWSLILKRFGFAALTPLSTTIDVRGKGTLHRLSVAGFENRAEADRTCGSIRSKGGVCFVRAVAGDAPTQWAARYASR